MNTETQEKGIEARETKINGIDLNPRKTNAMSRQALELSQHFKYHTAIKGQVPCYEAINEAARTFAEAIIFNVPVGPDQSAAIRKVIEAKQTANAAIATNPEQYQ